MPFIIYQFFIQLCFTFIYLFQYKMSNKLNQTDKETLEVQKKNQKYESSRPEKLNMNMLNNTNYKWLEYKILGKNILIRSYAATCYYQSHLYVYGGMQILNGILSDFHKINLDNDQAKYQWKQVTNKSPTNYPGPRAKHGMFNYKKKIYLIGGIKTATLPCNQIHSYDIQNQNWEIIKPQGEEIPLLESFCSTIIKDRIFLMMGFDAKKGILTNQVFEYNITNNTFTKLFKYAQQKSNQIPIPRSGAACASDNNQCIYLFGGKTQQTRLNDLWVFNLNTNKYNRINDKEDFKPKIRSGHTLNYYQRNLFLFGGIHQVTWQLDDLHIFNLKTNQWTTLQVDSARKKDTTINRSIEKKQSQQKVKSPDSATKKKNKNWFLQPTLSPVDQKKPKYDRQVSPQNSNKMRDQQKKKKFLQRKNQMLEVFALTEEQKKKFINIEPTSQAMKNSLDIIGNHDSHQKNSHRFMEFGKTTVSKFMEPLQNNSNWVLDKRPCARDGHNSILMGNDILIFGGDRHQMSFNDIYKINMQIIKKQIQF